MKKRILIPLIIVVISTVAATTYKSDFFEIAKQIEIFTDAYKQINMNYVDEVSPSELMDVAITSMFEHLDPYTNYWNSQQVENARLMHSGNYTGIGANIQSQKDKVILKEIYKDQPADKAGLKAGDELIKVGDIKISDFDNDAGELLKGAPGTSVDITFLRQGKTKTTTLKREKVKEKVVPFYKLINNDIGYIKLTNFMGPASEEVKMALLDLKSQDAKKIILDLRGNPGGYLKEAVKTANLFLPKDQLIVYTKSSVEKYNQTFSTSQEPVDTEIPVTVLINDHSASASEIVTGSIQDLDRGVVIGSQSFGKGLVQRPKKLKYGAQMKLTISRYYTPSGRCIQALDYWHRDKDGNPVRAKEKDYKVFHTKNGRKVYDAGGITPDIKMEVAEISPVTQALLDKNVIFDYATKYYYNHQLNSIDDFKFTDSDFNNFKAYLKQVDFNYTPETEKALKKAYENTKDDELKSKINSDYEALLTSINRVKTQEIDKNKTQIEQQLTNEILKRYFYEDGFYNYSVEHNPVIKRAIEVLNNQKEYTNILK